MDGNTLAPAPIQVVRLAFIAQLVFFFFFLYILLDVNVGFLTTFIHTSKTKKVRHTLLNCKEHSQPSAIHEELICNDCYVLNGELISSRTCLIIQTSFFFLYIF
ncbi:hypothetical protein HanPSC8_Chr17g0775341 [Helianthus annuus]|nr:hypothetical protein HanPSC8_Chr17g0775341 [Helianthus annuus]